MIGVRDYVEACRKVFGSEIADREAVEKHVQHYEAIDKLLPESASFFYVIETSKNQYHFMGQQQEKVSGFSNDEFKARGVGLLFERMHPEDVEIVLGKVYPAFAEFVSKLTTEELRALQTQYNFRFKRKDGKQINLMEQLYVLETDNVGKPSLILGNVITMPHSEPLPIRLAIKLIRETGFSETVFSRTFDVYPDHIEKLTIRETDILRNLALGKTSREIGEELNISKHTVDTHRRSLLKKLECKSVVELVQYAFSYGLL